jgi:hypothetical protein
MTDPVILTQLALLEDARLPPKKNEKTRNFHTHWVDPSRLPRALPHRPL